MIKLYEIAHELTEQAKDRAPIESGRTPLKDKTFCEHCEIFIDKEEANKMDDSNYLCEECRDRLR